MTRQVTIVNTSNSHGEDMVVECQEYDAESEVVKLAPGDKHTFYLDDALTITAESLVTTRKQIKPMYDKSGVQVIPVVSVDLKPV